MSFFRSFFRRLFSSPINQPGQPAPRADPAPRPVQTEPRAAPKPGGGGGRYPTREERAGKARALCAKAQAVADTTLSGKCWVIDGDTIVIKHVHIRLAGIDAPELDQPYGKKSKWALHALTKGQVVTAHIHSDMSYDRVVATCCLPDGRDLAGELVRQGLALDWPQFSKGKYAALEPEGVRRKLWRANAKQGCADTPAGRRFAQGRG